MPLVLAIVIGLLLVRPAGGSYRTLSEAHVHWSILFLAGTVAQLALAPLLSGRIGSGAPTVAWLVGGLLLIAACLANARVPGFAIAALGVGLNTLVIAVNSGMPVDVGALVRAGGDPATAIQADTIYHLAHDATRLLLLADVMPLPGPPFVRGVASLGDLVLCVGVVAAILHLAMPRARYR